MQRLSPEQIQMLLGQLQQRFGPAPGADAPAGGGQQAPPNLRGQIPQKGSGQRGAWNRMVEGMRRDQFMGGLPKQPSATEAVASAAPNSPSPDQVSAANDALGLLGRSPVDSAVEAAAGASGGQTLQQFPAGDTQNVDIARALAERMQGRPMGQVTPRPEIVDPPPRSGRAAFDAPGFNIANQPSMQLPPGWQGKNLGLQGQGSVMDAMAGLQDQKVQYAKPMIPKANSAGNTRLSPGVYRNAQGQTIKSKTGR